MELQKRSLNYTIWQVTEKKTCCKPHTPPNQSQPSYIKTVPKLNMMIVLQSLMSLLFMLEIIMKIF